MTPLPKRRHSSRRQAKRTRALKTAQISLTKCPQCGQMKLPHLVCPECGFYDGRVVFLKKEKDSKKSK